MEVKWKGRAAAIRRAYANWGRSLTENFKRNKKFWKEVKRVCGGECGREERVKGVDGKLLVEEREVRERWAWYFRELLDVEDEREPEIVAIGFNERVTRLDGENERSISEIEIQTALGKKRSGKTPDWMDVMSSV